MIEQIKCPNCGTLINNLDSNYCPHCGFSLKANRLRTDDDRTTRNQNKGVFSYSGQQKALGVESNSYRDNHRYGFGYVVFFKVVLVFLALGIGLGVSFCWVFALWYGLINIGEFRLLFYFPSENFTVAMMSNAIPTILFIYFVGMYRIKWFENLAIVAKNGKELQYMETTSEQETNR